MEVKWVFVAQDIKPNEWGTTDIRGIGNQLSIAGPPWVSTHMVVLAMGLEISATEIGETKRIGIELVDINTRDFHSYTELPYSVQASFKHWARHPEALTIPLTAIAFPHPGEFDLVISVDGIPKNSAYLRAINIEEWEHEAYRGHAH